MTTPNPATPEARALLERRARALAGEGDAAGNHAAAHAAVAVLVARRSGAAFAVRAADVRDVRRDARVTPLPGADRPVIGLVAWRGQGLVVHDVLPGAGVPGSSAIDGATAPWLLVVGGHGSELALLADEVDDIVDVDPDALAPAPDGAPPSHGATTDGMLLLDLRGWLALHSAP